MAKLDANIDACRISGEILLRLRKIIREGLRAAHGGAWDEAGIPAEIREVLLQRQAREASINWNLSDSADALDFAGYVELHDIIAATPGLLQRFLPLAPEAHVLRIRFLELDTILSRIAYCRPISEADLGFLVTFEERLKRSPAPVTAAPEEGARTRSQHPAPPAPEPHPAAKPKAAPASPRAAPAAAPAPKPAPAPPAEPKPEPEAAPAQPAASASPLVGPQEIETALKRGDNKVVLTALYQEVTALADGLWNGSVSSLHARAWESVRESQWYRERFTQLGLKPVSDFFGLFDAAREKMLSGTSRNDLQEFLKEHNFVQVLLALKEVFKQHVRP